VSNADVASSSNSTLGFLTSALAMAILCFCPPDNCVPFEPNLVSYPYNSNEGIPYLLYLKFVMLIKS